MRERKYRAYHDEWGWALSEDISIYGDGTIYVDYRDENGNKISCYTEKTKELHVMDYIGLKDKNGKEIYEEDIVKWYGHEVRNGKQIRPMRKFIVTSDIVVLFKVKNLIESNRTVEIIGNKYNNPELLEK